MHAGLDEDPAARAAVLAGVVEDRIRRFGGPALQVGIGEDDVRALAAQLQADLLDGGRGQPHDLLPGGRLAGEGDLADARVRRQGRAGRAARPGDHVDHAGRDAGLQRQLAQANGGQRRIAGGLEDRRIAGRQRGAKLPRGHVEREVPGHDQAADTDRLTQREVKAGSADRDRLAKELVGGAGVVVEDQADGEGLAAGALDRLADVGRLQLGQLLHVGLDQAGVLGQRPAALGGGPRCPALRVLERPLGGLHRPIHVLRSAQRRGGDHLAGGRVGNVEGLSVGGVDLLAANDHLHVARGSDGLRFRSHAPILGALQRNRMFRSSSR